MVKTISDLIEKAGGSLKIAYDIGVHQYTVLRWRKHGVPKKYFPYFEKRGVSRVALSELCRQIKSEKF